MENEKKVYEEPVVTMVKFDFSERIAASNCIMDDMDACGCESPAELFNF